MEKSKQIGNLAPFLLLQYFATILGGMRKINTRFMRGANKSSVKDPLVYG